MKVIHQRSQKWSVTERRDSEPPQLIYLWISDGFWIITILLPGGSIGNYSKPCLRFCLLAIINMQSQGHSQGKNHKMKPFLFSCPPLPRPPSPVPSSPTPLGASAPVLSLGHWHQLFWLLFFGRVCWTGPLEGHRDLSRALICIDQDLCVTARLPKKRVTYSFY